MCRNALLSRKWKKSKKSPRFTGYAYSNADASNRASLLIAESIGKQLIQNGHQVPERENKLSAQTVGTLFEQAVAEFVSSTFPRLQGLRPGNWDVVQAGTQRGKNRPTTLANFSQYEHLAELADLVEGQPGLQASLGNDYVVASDVVVSRGLYTDEELNQMLDDEPLVDDNTATRSSLRKRDESSRPILHASISAKFTIRSDRAQNSRTEALNLIRNRKGNLPHVVVVTAEPLPTRLASLALGTGDIDCVYHFALEELCAAVTETEDDSAQDMLKTLVEGRRLKDISDLPLDLAV